MRLGARWRVGESPHASVPADLHSAIRDAEIAHPRASSWTLTWLENRPRCALDDVLIATIDQAGVVQLVLVGQDHEDNEDDDWLL